VLSRDPACRGYSQPLLYFKGFHAIQAYRIGHYYWTHNHEPLALYLQSQISEVFAVDIHPGAQIGKGIMFDHATSVVIGATAVVEDDFSMLHEVTLGGTGRAGGDRHPKDRPRRDDRLPAPRCWATSRSARAPRSAQAASYSRTYRPTRPSPVCPPRSSASRPSPSRRSRLDQSLDGPEDEDPVI